MRLLPLIFAIGCAAATTTTPPRGAFKNFTVQPLAPGVWAVIHNDFSAASANAGIIDLGDATLVFDTFMTPEAGAELRDAAHRLTGRRGNWVVLSHWHNDHIRGAQTFDGATIIATDRTRQLIMEKEPEEIEGEKKLVDARIERDRKRLEEETDPERRRERLFWLSYNEATKRSHPILRLTPPGLTFQKRAVFHGTARSVELLELHGHTTSDAIAWLPSERIAFMGDLHFVKHHPYLPDGDPDAHRAALRTVRDLRPAHLVPGHGPVSGAESLDVLIDYIDAIERRAAELLKTSATDDDAMKEIAPRTYDGWWFSVFYRQNVRFMLRRMRSDRGM